MTQPSTTAIRKSSEPWYAGTRYDPATLPPVDRAITRYRTAAAALRGIRRNGGKTRATDYAIERHELSKVQAVGALLAAGHSRVVGDLTEEEALVERVRQATVQGDSRPELRVRILNLRCTLRVADREIRNGQKVSA